MKTPAPKKLTIICPCCEASLTVDAETGAIYAHHEKAKASGSFDELTKNLERQKQERENIFAQQMNAEKDRGRLLDEKFREAFKNVDQTDDKPYQNPLDLD